MPVGIVEVDAAAIIPVVDFIGLLTKRVRPITEFPPLNAAEDLVELALRDQKRIVQLWNLSIGSHVDEVERRIVAHSKDRELAEANGFVNPSISAKKDAVASLFLAATMWWFNTSMVDLSTTESLFTLLYPEGDARTTCRAP